MAAALLATHLRYRKQLPKKASYRAWRKQRSGCFTWRSLANSAGGAA